ncbi:ABC transporter ATP-binding protein [Microbacterium yannicii]|uniref:ABC transporter ATP-binding protein n=1 Tax=Microbacterium yannicii TaxID=671622 RepID=UPI0002EEE62A|nr:ABC transporter ATP-binding protein [Microbacterium yannicii]
MSAALELRELTVTYGGVVALDHVSFEVPRGSLVGLIGPNGAGKTTLIDAVTGFTRSRGNVIMADASLAGLPPHSRARRGLRRTWQHGELFDDLSVRENLSVAADLPRAWRTLSDIVRGRSGPVASVADTLRILGLEELADTPASELSEGQRKLVGVGRALAPAPELLLLDEPAAGLDTSESAELGHVLRDVVDRGTTMLLVDHDMGLVMGICDHLVVLDFGRVIAQGTPAEVQANPDVITAYLGAPQEGTIS